MGIPTTLTIYVPDEATPSANGLRKELREALLAAYVGVLSRLGYCAKFSPGENV